MVKHFDDLEVGDKFTNSKGDKVTVTEIKDGYVYLITEHNYEYNTSKYHFNIRVDKGMYTDFHTVRRYHIDDITEMMPLMLNQKEHEKLSALDFPDVNLHTWIPSVEAYFTDGCVTENLKRYHPNQKPIRFNQLILPKNKNHEVKNTIDKKPTGTGQGIAIISTCRSQTAIGSRQVGNIQTAKFQEKRIVGSKIKGTILSL